MLKNKKKFFDLSEIFAKKEKYSLKKNNGWCIVFAVCLLRKRKEVA